MQCPVDGETLVMADRGGVEIDYCPKCRGVWLDRGELDKIIERSLDGQEPAPAPAAAAQRPAPASPSPVYQREPERPRSEYREHGRRYDDDDDYRYKHRRKKSFLGEIFDF
jgi:uncharacterized protein